MIELGQLEKRQADFAQRNIRIVAVSNDDVPTTKLTQDKFPHLTIVSDANLSIAKAMEVIHAGASPEGKDTSAPTTFLIDSDGTVRWFFRPDLVVVRLTPEELLAKIDPHLARTK